MGSKIGHYRKSIASNWNACEKPNPMVNLVDGNGEVEHISWLIESEASVIMFITFKKERAILLIETNDFSVNRHDSTRGVPGQYHTDRILKEILNVPSSLDSLAPAKSTVYGIRHNKPCLKKQMIKVKDIHFFTTSQGERKPTKNTCSLDSLCRSKPVFWILRSTSNVATIALTIVSCLASLKASREMWSGAQHMLFFGGYRV